MAWVTRPDPSREGHYITYEEPEPKTDIGGCGMLFVFGFPVVVMVLISGWPKWLASLLVWVLKWIIESVVALLNMIA